MKRRNSLIRTALLLAAAVTVGAGPPAWAREISFKIPLLLSIEPETLSVTEAREGSLPSVTYERRTVEETRIVGGHRNHPSVVEMMDGWNVKEHTTHNGTPVTIYVRTATKDIAIEGEAVAGRLSIEVRTPVAPDLAGALLRGSGGAMTAEVSREGFDGADPARIEEEVQALRRAAEAKLGRLLQALAVGAELADADLASLMFGEVVVVRLALGSGVDVAFEVRQVMPGTRDRTGISDRLPVEE